MCSYTPCVYTEKYSEYRYIGYIASILPFLLSSVQLSLLQFLYMSSKMHLSGLHAVYMVSTS